MIHKGQSTINIATRNREVVWYCRFVSHGGDRSVWKPYQSVWVIVDGVVVIQLATCELCREMNKEVRSAMRVRTEWSSEGLAILLW
jgi:hypothetical protein